MNCTNCDVELIVGSNYHSSNKKNRIYKCNKCLLGANRIKHRRVDALLKREKALEARQKCIAVLGGKCVMCGFDDERALCLDHVNGGGTAQRKSISPSQYYTVVLNEILAGSIEYQCLCANCNKIKAIENKEYNQKKYVALQG